MSPESAPVPDKPRIYIVDDDAAVRSAVDMLISTCGWESVPCASAEEFFQHYVPGRNQCLILDLRMPGNGGAEVQARLERQGESLPVILVTAHSELPEARAARDRGAVALFGKPFDGTELLDCVRRTLAMEAPSAHGNT